MPEYDRIRPFNDHEVATVVERVVKNPNFGKAASKLVMPEMLQGTNIGEWITSQVLRHKTRHLRTVHDCQLFIADYFERLIDETIDELTVSGIEHLDKSRCYLFMSNHRDIVMDSGLLNFLIHSAGHETCRMAVGDNLLTNELAADLMRLNKSFVVERNVSGARATMNALTLTSRYIRHSVEEGVSIWIAQREGRAKDGWDRTDPALLKMLGLAYREDKDPLERLLEQVTIVPVSISYELDPCALRKAHELSVVAEHGQYDKSDEEDLQSIVLGMVGWKGRVHLHFNEPLEGQFDSPEELALGIDRSILGGMRLFPTHVMAAKMLGDHVPDSADVETKPEIMRRFDEQLAACPEPEREYVLVQYANVLRNRKDLGIATD
jgi:1-acyl-sn-glycerol-3-phosphate acyltransferase